MNYSTLCALSLFFLMSNAPTYGMLGYNKFFIGQSPTTGRSLLTSTKVVLAVLVMGGGLGLAYIIWKYKMRGPIGPVRPVNVSAPTPAMQKQEKETMPGEMAKWLNDMADQKKRSAQSFYWDKKIFTFSIVPVKDGMRLNIHLDKAGQAVTKKLESEITIKEVSNWLGEVVAQNAEIYGT